MSAEYEFYLGSWAYRSLHNNPDLSTAFNDLYFGSGKITIKEIAYDQILDGTLNLGGGFELRIRGELLRERGVVTEIRLTGTGVTGTATEGWVYDYRGARSIAWSGASGQADVIVGSVIRTVAHGSAAAGYTATFYMVKMSESPQCEQLRA